MMRETQARASAKVAMVADEINGHSSIHYHRRSGAWKENVSYLLLVLIPNCRRTYLYNETLRTT